MTEKEYLYLLLHAAGTGAVTAQRLYEHFGSYEHIATAAKIRAIIAERFPLVSVS